MAVFNFLRKEIDAKIVYYGPGISGKTTNLQYIHEHLKHNQRGKMVSLATNEDRTLFFDFLPIELESVRGFKTRFHLYTVPGQVYYGATRRAVLTGADGVVFVADSQAERMEDNKFSLKDLEDNLRYYGKKMEATPFVMQYNKRDLPNILSVEDLNQKINTLNFPFFEAAALNGQGVFETLTMICRLVLKAIEAGAEARRPTGVSDTAAEAPPPRISRVEKVPPRLEPLKPTPDAVAAKPVDVRVEREAPPPEPPRAPKIPPLVSAKPEAETISPDGRTIFNRIFDRKKPEPPLKLEEKREKKIPDVSEKLRIISCGQPHISSPSSLEIPLTVEVEGLEKSLSFSLAIKLEQLDQKNN